MNDVITPNVLSEEPAAASLPRVRKPRASKPVVTKRAASDNETGEFKAWLATLNVGITPTLHVNGPAFPACVVAVDFGTPIKSVKLTPDQGSELVSRMRGVTKLVVARGDVKIGVLNDYATGIWWSSIS